MKTRKEMKKMLLLPKSWELFEDFYYQKLKKYSEEVVVEMGFSTQSHVMITRVMNDNLTDMMLYKMFGKLSGCGYTLQEQEDTQYYRDFIKSIQPMRDDLIKNLIQRS
jgi:hypothetical protein